MSVHPSVLAGFGSAAAAYERARPEYPADAVAWLAGELGLGPGSCVVDLAAGTGKLTRALVPTGARVVAIEPVDTMRAELVRAVPGAEAIAGVAEEIPLPSGSADAVTVAQAFHWFASDEALTEIARVLRPGGKLGLIWNTRPPDNPLQQRIAEIVEPYRTDEQTHVGRGWRPVLERNLHFDLAAERTFPHGQRFDGDGLAERVASTSFVAVLPDDEKQRVLARVRALARGGEVELPYVTEVYAATRAAV